MRQSYLVMVLQEIDTFPYYTPCSPHAVALQRLKNIGFTEQLKFLSEVTKFIKIIMVMT